MFGCKTCLEKIVVIYHLGSFDGLMQSGFWVVIKIAFTNLCRVIHDVMVIPVSSDLLNLESLDSNGKNNKKKWISRERVELFRWNKKHTL